MVLTARCRSCAHCRAERFERDRGIDDMGLGHRVLGYFFPSVGADMAVLILRKKRFRVLRNSFSQSFFREPMCGNVCVLHEMCFEKNRFVLLRKTVLWF